MPLPSGKPVKAKKIGNSLITAFPGANPPIVWKFDLEKNHSFTMALQGEDGDWELGVTSPRGEFCPVARFLAREDADDAFACAQKAMLKRDYNSWRIIGPICLFLVLLWIVLALFQVIRHGPVGMTAGTPTASSSPGMANPTMGSPIAMPTMQMKEGVPQPADQVLTPPQ